MIAACGEWWGQPECLAQSPVFETTLRDLDLYLSQLTLTNFYRNDPHHTETGHLIELATHIELHRLLLGWRMCIAGYDLINAYDRSR